MEIRAYQTATGRSPFQDWYDALNDPASVRVTRTLEQLAKGNLSNAKSVGSGVHEYRIDFGPGYRIYFGREGLEIVLLLTGGDKRRQQRDINAAISYWTDHKRHARGNQA